MALKETLASAFVFQQRNCMMPYLVALYIALPAFIANMAPVFAAKLDLPKRFSRPISARLLGENKTWRGFIAGVLGGVIAALLQWFVFAPHFASISHAFFFGALGGAGALVGDSAKSFLKRRLKIPPGRPFIPLDYVDYMIGFLLFTYPLYSWSMQDVVFLVAAVIILNPLTNLFGYITGIKNTYW